MIRREKEQVIQIYQEAVLIAICVADVMHGVTEDVAIGLMQRYEKDQCFLKILVLMYKPNSVEFTYESIFKAMMQLNNDDPNTFKKFLLSLSLFQLL